MLAKLTPATVALLLLAFVVVVGVLVSAILLVRGQPIPDTIARGLAPLLTLLVGWVVPAPKAGAS